MKFLKVLILLSFASTASAFSPSEAFQHDADILRLEHIEYWSGLFEEYQKKEGHYPFQNLLDNPSVLGLVKIITKNQSEYLQKGTNEYREDLDMNAKGRFTEKDVSELVVELERVLERTISGKYDIQSVPTQSPVGYYYFFTNDGYLIWTTYFSGGVTPISTLLYDGYTPTVNIVSEGMKENVTKALTREEMLRHKIYKKWKKKKLLKEEYVRNLERSLAESSKQELNSEPLH
ncbi:hypothetical protein MLD52_18960 [Puniceicoccaceae bacterium K14]|nr:hypothetical protein [Puniceicoccaceae bacterium K14]